MIPFVHIGTKRDPLFRATLFLIPFYLGTARS